MTAVVLRWHSHSDPRLRMSGDTVFSHGLRVENSAFRLCIAMRRPYSDNLRHMCRHHDDAERVIGDTPGPAKARFPLLRWTIAAHEFYVLRQMGHWRFLWHWERRVLRLCDRLDAMQWARKRGVTGGEWIPAEAKLRRMAEKLGPRAAEWINQELDATATACNQ